MKPLGSFLFAGGALALGSGCRPPVAHPVNLGAVALGPVNLGAVDFRAVALAPWPAASAAGTRPAGDATTTLSMVIR